MRNGAEYRTYTIQQYCSSIAGPASQLDWPDGCGAGTLFALPHLVIYSLAFLETVEGPTLDLGIVEEQIVLLRIDKPEPSI